MISFNNLNQETPYLLFKEKYDEALDAGQKVIEAISISSFNKQIHEVDSRFVNLKFIADDEFIFFSNYDSPKASSFNTFLCLDLAVTDLVVLGMVYLLINFEAILSTIPDSLFRPLLCLFLFVDCLVRIWFLLALLLLTEEPVFLNRLAAPECVFNLYPMSFFFYF